MPWSQLVPVGGHILQDYSAKFKVNIQHFTSPLVAAVS